MTTLENLYYGNITQHEYEVERGSEYDVGAHLCVRLQDIATLRADTRVRPYTEPNT